MASLPHSRLSYWTLGDRPEVHVTEVRVGDDQVIAQCGLVAQVALAGNDVAVWAPGPPTCPECLSAEPLDLAG